MKLLIKISKTTLLAIFIFSTSSYAQQKNMAKEFIVNLSKSKNYNQIIDKYFCKPSNKDAIETIKMQLLYLKGEITKKKYSIKDYNQKSGIIQLDKKKYDKIYELWIDDKVLSYIIISHNKIISFSSMIKGNERIPLSFCSD